MQETKNYFDQKSYLKKQKSLQAKNMEKSCPTSHSLSISSALPKIKCSLPKSQNVHKICLLQCEKK